MPLSTGQKLGPYEILAPLGRRVRLRPHLAVASGARLGIPASTGRLMPARRARSRAARLLPRLLRETPRAATGDFAI